MQSACTATTSLPVTCIGLALTEGGPVLPGRETNDLLESSGKVALVIEAGSHSDVGERPISQRNFAASEFNPEPTDIFPNGTQIGPTKHSSKMSRMDVGGIGNIRQRHWLEKMSVQKVACVFEPLR